MKNRIKELRVSKNMNQNTLAKALGYSQQTISRIESGKSIPDIKTMQSIADFFHVSMDYLLYRSDIKNILENQDTMQTMLINNFEFFTLLNGMNSKSKKLLLHIAQSIVNDI